jgi:ABC-2 type transport system ATP-binding protein
MNTLAIDTQALRKEFGEKVAVSDLTMTVQRGEVFGFLGPNGAGKTTSIKMLLGLIAPTNGSATLLGKPLGDRETRGKVGYLPEHFRFHEWLEAAEFLDFHGRLYGMSKSQRQEVVPDLLELVGLK